MNTGSDAIRHATGLLTAMTNHFTSRDAFLDMVASPEYIPWLFDSYLSLHEAQTTRKEASPGLLPITLRSVMQLTTKFRDPTVLDAPLKQKGVSLLTLLAIDAIEHFEHFSLAMQDADAAIEMVSSSLLMLAALSSEQNSSANLLTMKLVPTLEKLASQGELVIPETDIWVSYTATEPFRCLSDFIIEML